ncbi:hypothetical protein L209DRAFT_762724 [Thermothelomyces heterothallicus CBS 203.75]
MAAMSSPSPSPSPSPTPPLLCLSPHIRQRIYRYLGLASWDGQPYTYKIKGGKTLYHSWYVPKPSSFHGLLLSCRALHAEAAALLYSANRFFIWYSSRRNRSRLGSESGLYFLHALTAPALRSLSRLKIVLNQASCHELDRRDPDTGSCCFYDPHRWMPIYSDGTSQCHGHPKVAHQHPLLSRDLEGIRNDVSKYARAVVRDWRSVAQRLLSGVTPGRLALSVVCDIDPGHPEARPLAELVVAPILLLPPGHLRKCNIRLAMTPDGRLQQLAKDAVCRSCGIATDPLPLPPNADPILTALPRELRLRILEYTDLVTPTRQVMWSGQDRAYSVFAFAYSDRGIADENHRAQFFRCWIGEDLAPEPPSPGCFCRRHHAAFSPACKCWAPPGPSLFLVCRTLYEDAQYVFFSKNRFTVHDYKISPPWALPFVEDCEEDELPPKYPYPNERFAASHFLREIVPAPSLAHLRFLELVFPPYRPGSWPETHHPAMQDWRATIDWLRPRINTRRLTLQLAVSNVGDTALEPYYRPITAEGARDMLKAYMDLVQPLARLADDGLARFYAHFPHPRKWTEEFRFNSTSHDWDRLRRAELALKEHAERCVLGSRYDSLRADGKEEPRLGDWKEMYWDC